MKTFIITDEDETKIKKFHPKCKKLYRGAIDGGEYYLFMPTGLGDVKQFKCKCGSMLDLTDVDKW